MLFENCQPRRHFAALAILLAAGLARHAMGSAAAYGELKPLLLETPLGRPGTPAASILAGKAYHPLARELSKEIADATRVRLPVVADTDAIRNLKGHGNLIALGSFADNRVLERLYYRWYVVVDGAQPGKGGYLLQTVHNPDALGINVVVAGGSDRAGVQRAAQRLMEHVKQNGTTLPRLLEVELGAGKDAVLTRGRKVLDPKRKWPTRHLMEVQQAIAEAGMLYVYTGNEGFAQAYKEKLMGWLKTDRRTGLSDDFDFTMITWDLLEESPVFSDEERLWITNRLWDALLKHHAPEEISGKTFYQVRDKRDLRHNHRARFASSLYFGARYFHQYYGSEQCAQWLEDVRQYWQPQMTSFAAIEGSSPMAHITLVKALSYALAENVESFLSRDVLGRIADKELMRIVGSRWLAGSGRTHPAIFWCLAAHRFNDSKYLLPLHRHDASMGQIRLPWRVSWEVGRSFWDGRSPEDTRSTVGAQWVNAMPFDRLFFEKARAYGPRNVGVDRAFELLVFQDPQLSGDQYLSLGGHCTGSYSADAANAITSFYSHGVRWLWGGGRVKTVHKHTSLSVVRDGQCWPLPAFAQLERAESTPISGISTTALLDYNGTDWRRNVLNSPGRWFLVIDDVTARQSDAYVLESRWFDWAHAAFDRDDGVFLKRSGKQTLELRLTGHGWRTQYLVPWLYSDYLSSPVHVFPRQARGPAPEGRPGYSAIIVRRWEGRLEKGQSHVLANLFYVHPKGDPIPYRLRRLGERRYLVRGEDRGWLVAADPDGQWSLVETSDPRQPSVGVSPTPAADEIPALRPRWQRKEPARILSSTVLSTHGGTRWAVGMADGRIRMMREDGTPAAETKMQGKVFSLCAMDLDGDGSQEMVAGSDAGEVCAFTSDGRRIWSWKAPPWTPSPGWRQMFGKWRAVITDVIPLTPRRAPAILAAGTFFYVLDSSGKMLCTYDRLGEYDVTDLPGDGWRSGLWRTLERAFVLAAGDVTGDGDAEILGDEPRVRYVRMWSAGTAKRLAVYSKPPDRYLGSCTKAVIAADFDGDGKDELAVGSDAYNYQIAMYGHPEGCLWQHNTGAAAEALATADLNGDGVQDLIAATGAGQIQAFDGKGNRILLTNIGQPVGSAYALAVVPAKRDTQIWAATVNGLIVAFDRGGEIIARAYLSGYVDHLTSHPDGTAILAASADGHMACYEVRTSAIR